jgi:hypothetical protein
MNSLSQRLRKLRVDCSVIRESARGIDPELLSEMAKTAEDALNEIEQLRAIVVLCCEGQERTGMTEEQQRLIDSLILQARAGSKTRPMSAEVTTVKPAKVAIAPGTTIRPRSRP